MQRYVTILTVFALITAGCGGSSQEAAVTASAEPRPAATAVVLPAGDEAKSIIENSPEWSDFQFSYSAWSFQLDRPIEHPTTRQLADDLEAAGWLKVSRDGVIQLTEKASSDKRFLVRQNATLDIVPMAKKEVGDVVSIKAQDDGTAQVEFGWRWIPNEVGSSFKRGFILERYSAPQSALATLQRNADGWAVSRIDPKG